MKKVIISGANGMLAKDLIECINAKQDYEVFAYSKQALDITNREKVMEVFTRIKPNYVIHTAALTNVDYCENKPDEAYRVNGVGTGNLAFYSREVDAKFIYISSCGLFGDYIKSYSESDAVTLKTVYAKSKYLGEEKIKEYLNKYFIIRPGWLFGGDKNHKKNFVYNRYKEARQKSDIYSASDKYGCPTYTYHLSEKILELMETDFYGIYHVTNSGAATRYDYVKKIVDSFGTETNVHSVDSSYFVRSAPVPNCEILMNKNLRENGFELLPSWQKALEEYIKKLNKAFDERGKKI